jgi:hypothetical protein
MTQDIAQISPAELIKLCAVDTELFGRYFFPRAFRDPSPSFAKRSWELLEDPRFRNVNLRFFRGSSKTTRLRVYTAKRVAYGLSRTILYVGASEDHAKRSVQWLRGQIEARLGNDGAMRRSEYAELFDLKPGKKWSETEIEVFHGLDARPIWILGVGITGNVRGINFDDYRPDLIILDDVVTDENAATEDQREKLKDLVLGSLYNSLAPTTEEPNAKMVMLQTPIDARDVSMVVENDSRWTTETFGCWTPETQDLPLPEQESSWKERYPSDTLRKEKQAAVETNTLSKFAREMECKLVSAETMSFRPNWVRFYDEAPKSYQAVLVIDPVPPPSDRQLKDARYANKDFEAHAVVGRSNGEYYLLDYRIHRGHDPSWSAATMFELGSRYRISRIILETIGAQRYLKWFLEQEMTRKQFYFAIKDAPGDQRPKFVRITTAMNGPCSQGKFWCRKEHLEFLEQFYSYGVGYKGHDDLLEAVAGGVKELTNPYLELGVNDYSDLDDSSVEKFPRRLACP